MLSPLPRHSGWAHYFAHSPCRISLPRYGSRVGLCIVLFEACSAFTRVTACTLAPSPIRDALSEGFSHFVTSIAAPVASGWSVCRVGLAPTGKRRLSTAHAISRPQKLNTCGYHSEPGSAKSLSIRIKPRGSLEGERDSRNDPCLWFPVHARAQRTIYHESHWGSDECRRCCKAVGRNSQRRERFRI